MMMNEEQSVECELAGETEVLGENLPQGLAVAQAVSRWLPTAAARVRVRGLLWTKRHWGRFSPSTSVSPANHSTNFFSIIITRGWHNRPIDGRRAEWTQLDSTPHYTN
jgi:hypothetical protein